MTKTLLLLFTLAVLFAAAGCGTTAENNYLRPEDFASYLERSGVKVDGARPLSPRPFLATSAVGIMVDGSEIGVYKFDRTSEVQQRRIDRLAQKKRTYINGIIYPVEVYGSFMFLGLEKNQKKHEIKAVIQKFK